MITRIARDALALTLLGSVALLGTPTFAVEPDVDSPAGPELPAPRTDRPDFQQDDQSGAVIDPQTEELIQASHPTWWSLNRQPQ